MSGTAPDTCCHRLSTLPSILEVASRLAPMEIVSFAIGAIFGGLLLILLILVYWLIVQS